MARCKLERIEQPKLLFVEGYDELALYRALAAHLRISDMQVITFGGKDNLKVELEATCVLPGFAEVRSVGIVRDADCSPEGAFCSVQCALRQAIPKLRVPSKPLQWTRAVPRVGIFIQPSPQANGALETMCLKAVEADAAMSCVNQLFECLKRGKVPSPKNLPKAKAYAFLATRPEPGKRIGEAGSYWNWESDAWDSVKTFLAAM